MNRELLRDISGSFANGLLLALKGLLMVQVNFIGFYLAIETFSEMFLEEMINSQNSASPV